MAKDYRRLWKSVVGTIDEARAVRTLADILVDKEGNAFVSRLERNDAELCIEILYHVSHDLLLSPAISWFRQGIMKHDLNTTERGAFRITLRRLAGYYGRLPDPMMITAEIPVEGTVLVRGGSSDVRVGMYLGNRVAVKTLMVRREEDLQNIREVSINDIPPPLGIRCRPSSPAILQTGYPLGDSISSEHLETRWR